MRTMSIVAMLLLTTVGFACSPTLPIIGTEKAYWVGPDTTGRIYHCRVSSDKQETVCEQAKMKRLKGNKIY